MPRAGLLLADIAHTYMLQPKAKTLSEGRYGPGDNADNGKKLFGAGLMHHVIDRKSHGTRLGLIGVEASGWPELLLAPERDKR
jgi:hypothetical protein